MDIELDEGKIDSGWLPVGPQAAQSLGLPRHREEITLIHEDEKIEITWDAARRKLGGEALQELLALEASVGDLGHLRREGDDLLLSIGAHRRSLRSVSSAPGRWTTRPKTADTSDAQASPRQPGQGRSRRGNGTKRTRSGTQHALRRRDEYDFKQHIGIYRPSRRHLAAAIAEGGWDERELVDLRVDVEELSASADWDHLLALDLAHVDRFWWQEAAARRALKVMRGRAVLADEVGLGKTIEAGLIMKELELRGLVRSALILTPGSLREQWRDELDEKFDMDFTALLPPIDKALWETENRLIATRMAAVRSRETVTDRQWDLVVVDEAHNLTGAGAKATRELMLGLDARYMLFLTATPVQNSLDELYRLVSFLRPGTFASLREFKDQFVDRRDPRTPRDPEKLRQLVKDVMIRTTREQAGIDKVTRHVRDVPVKLSPDEQSLYHEVTDVLRGVMTSPADGSRRRFLAHRLASSPRNLAKTALRMAHQTTDPRAASALQSIGERAADIRNSSREQTAVKEVLRSLDWQRKTWRGEPPRLLVFTQQTDSVEALHLALGEAGVAAEPFHGGMAQKRRRQSIRSFLDGDVPVLLSTAAGAEGHNLQACNVVLNYDLPWNPMRLEQQIGRVHRVTQTRDVHVVNMFALGTLEEQIYALLKDKLRMFELLFGQITTILGELDEGDKASTFEGRIFDALYARDDRRMAAKIGKLGDELADARSKSQTSIDGDAAISAWAVDHRASIPEGGATDLVPDRVKTDDEKRQKRTESVIRQVLEALGAEIDREARGFLSAVLPDDVADELQRDDVHLAFSRSGLDEHLDAELCAPGSAIFDELVEAMRERGDLHATVPIPPNVGLEHSRRTSVDVHLRSRRLLPPQTLSGRIAARVVFPDGTEEVMWIPFGDEEPEYRTEVRTLNDGEALTEHLHRPISDLLENTSEVIRQHLAVRQMQADEATKTAANVERRRQINFYNDQLHEARPAETRQLQEALSAVQRSRPKTAELRVEMLALELAVHDDFQVIEVWQLAEDGPTHTLTASWTPALNHPITRSDGQAVSVLSLCDEGHIEEGTERRACERCERLSCRDCDETFYARAACIVCDTQICASCADDEPLCVACLNPARSPENDTAYEHAYAFGDGVIGMVAPGSLTMRHPGEPPVVVLAESETDSEDRAAAMPYLIEHGLPPMSAVTRSDGDADPISGILLRSSESIDVDVSVRDVPSEQVAISILPHLPPPQLSVSVSPPGELIGVFNRLQEQRGDALVPSLHVDVTGRRTSVVLSREGLSKVVDRSAPSGNAREVSEHAPWAVGDPVEPAEDGLRPVLSCALGGVDIEVLRAHTAHIVHVDVVGNSTQRWALPAASGEPLNVELAVAKFISAHTDLPTNTHVRLDEHSLDPRAPEPPSPPLATLVERQEAATLRPAPDLMPAGSLGAEVLAAAGIPVGPAPTTQAPPDTAMLQDVLDRLTPMPQPATLALHHQIREAWRGRSQATVTYELGPAERGVLIGERLCTEFEVDDFGHLVEAERRLDCPSCEQTGCDECGLIGMLEPCRECQQEACGRCRDRAHPNVADGECVICSWRSCTRCGHDPRTVSCHSCDRDVCRNCVVAGSCPTCLALEPTHPRELGDLQTVLALAGCAVATAEDQDARIVRIEDEHRRELAVCRGREVIGWWTHTTDELLPIRLAAARRAGTGRVDIQIRADARLSASASNAFVVSVNGETEIRWAITSPGADDSASATPPASNAPIASGHVLAERTDAAVEALGGLTTQPVPSWPLRLPASEARWDTATATALLHLARSEERITLTSAGLRTERLQDGQLQENLSGWQAHPTPAWVAEEWPAAPPTAQVVTGAGRAVVLLRAGQYCVVGLRAPEGTLRWYHLSGGTDDIALSQLALGRELLGRAVRLAPSAVTYANQLNPPSVADGTLIDRQTFPHVVEETSTGALSTTELHRAARTLAADALRVPETGAAPNSLVNLSALGQDDTDRVDATIGLRVNERWRQGDQTVEFRYIVTGGEVDGYIPLFDGGRARKAWLDRGGHLTDAPEECAYCERISCTSCQTPVSGCRICGILQCEDCTPGGICRACTKLQRVARSAAKAQGLKVGMFKKVLQGKDRLHVVHAFRGAEGIAVAGGPEDRTLTPDDPNFADLDALL